MKRIPCFLLCMLLILSMTACSVDFFPPLSGGTEQPVPEAKPTDAPSQPSEAFEVSEAPEETVAPTEAAEESTATKPVDITSSASREFLKVRNRDELIFDTPTYDGRFVDTVRVAGSYTIVAKLEDPEGNLWGLLKSGVGWINISSASANNAANLIISGAELTYTPSEEEVREYGTKTDYTTPVIIHCYDQIENIRIYRLTHDGSNLVQDELLYTVPELLPEWPLIVHLEFAGSMSMFGISFLDVNGTEHHYSIQQNGRNNATQLAPYILR